MKATELSHAPSTHPSSSTPFPVAKGDSWKPQWTGRFHLMGSDWLSQLTLMEVMAVCHPQAFAALPAAHHCREEGCESTTGSEEREWVSEWESERERGNQRKKSEKGNWGPSHWSSWFFFISFQSWNMPVSLQLFDTSVFVSVCVHVDRHSTLLKRVHKVS